MSRSARINKCLSKLKSQGFDTSLIDVSLYKDADSVKDDDTFKSETLTKVNNRIEKAQKEHISMINMRRRLLEKASAANEATASAVQEHILDEESGQLGFNFPEPSPVVDQTPQAVEDPTDQSQEQLEMEFNVPEEVKQGAQAKVEKLRSAKNRTKLEETRREY
jgi:translation initiation factor 2B subunit (eIF-2B alpha/beta/delta family)